MLLAGGTSHRNPGRHPRPGVEIHLADSALHPPRAGFGDVEFYADLHDKARPGLWLTWNRPLTDGNKRAAWATLVIFVALNDGFWDPGPPNIDEAEAAMLAIAAGEFDEPRAAGWLRERVHFGDAR